MYEGTYAGPRWTYGLTLRPLGYANVPDGYILFSNREHADYRFCIVDYPFPIEERTARQMDLELIEEAHP